MTKGVKGLVHGWGLTDVSSYIDGTRETCPFYRKWVDLVKRVHSEKYHLKYPTYKECSITEEWQKASGFESWMKSQDWEGLELDKDILTLGNKYYSPETCVFVPKYVNYLFLMRDACRGAFPVGVQLKPVDKRYCASKQPVRYHTRVNNGFGAYISLGTFKDQQDAHLAWQHGKIDAILNVLQRYRNETCYREDVEESLFNRVEMIKTDILFGRETLKI